MGAELCLAHDMGGGGVEAYGGAPFGRHAALRLFHCIGCLLKQSRKLHIFYIQESHLTTKGKL